MLKISKAKLIITSIVILIPMAVGLILWNQLPEEMVTHWGVGNVPDGWSNKAVTVFGLPAFLLIIHWVCLIATKADPKSKNINPKVMNLVLWICPLISLLVLTATYAYALGHDINVEIIVNIFIGVLFVIIGNYLPKCKQSYTVGIKLPWTLNDEENWNKTHRLGGILWVVSGIIMIVTALFSNAVINIIVIVTAIVVPTVYSYVLYRKKLNK
ncbi:MAG: SdpI family protein [Clostridia bacterium]|nr:SdpI family protein [Clostridia bacterium]